jgi:hypothetical protein
MTGKYTESWAGLYLALPALALGVALRVAGNVGDKLLRCRSMAGCCSVTLICYFKGMPASLLPSCLSTLLGGDAWVTIL